MRDSGEMSDVSLNGTDKSLIQRVRREVILKTIELTTLETN